MNKLLLAVLFFAISGRYSSPDEVEEFIRDFNNIRLAYAEQHKISDIKNLTWDAVLGVTFNSAHHCVPKDQIELKPGEVVYTSMNDHNKIDEAMKKMLGDPAMKLFGYAGHGKCKLHKKVLVMSPGESPEKSSGASSSSVNFLMVVLGVVLVFVA